MKRLVGPLLIKQNECISTRYLQATQAVKIKFEIIVRPT
jgi:hypothetical protein